jgi:ubiquitin carboxyl-terminal hydrolase 48
LGYLEGVFKKSKDPELRDIIAREFEGIGVYTTTCKICNRESRREHTFHELELSILENRSLSSCLKALCSEEKLSGQNKYDCDTCGLVDATRRFVLCKLPPVLNIQLLRFVYDAATGTKKKLSTDVKFPRTLDMSAFVG